MLLAIDVGNTQTCVGIFSGTELKHRFRMSTNHHRTSDEYGVLLREILSDTGVKLQDLTQMALACVVPPLTGVFIDLGQRKLRLEPLVVGVGIKTGMPILVEQPRSVGADRIVNGIAGFEKLGEQKGKLGVIVVDFGTATTFDVVSPEGAYLGGAIAPGVQISTDALYARAAHLPRIEIIKPKQVVGKSTVTSMQSGVFWGYVGLVDGMVDRMREELSFDVKVIATGGLAASISAESRTIEEVDDALTLEGLRIVFERNV
jgi:type III pantothenate kinase